MFSQLLWTIPSLLAGDGIVEESALDKGLYDPTAIYQKEVEWAQASMERYRQKKDCLPTRSSVHIADGDIFTNEWVLDSIDFLQGYQGDSGYTEESGNEDSTPTRISRALRGKRD